MAVDQAITRRCVECGGKVNRTKAGHVRCSACRLGDRSTSIVRKCLRCGVEITRRGKKGPSPRYCGGCTRHHNRGPKPCVRCGELRVSTRGSKCPTCRSETAAYNAVKTCAVCGVEFTSRQTGKKTCGVKCGRLLIAKTQGWGIRGWVERECPSCHKKFRRKKRTRDAGKYCSRECAFADPHRYAHRQPGVVFTVAHRRARRAVVASIQKAVIKAAKAVKAEAKKAALVRVVREKACSGCGIYFLPSKHQQRLCSCACKEKSRRSARRKARVKHGSKRISERCVKFGVPYQRGIGPVGVCDRDGWKCKLCGTATPRRLRGTYKPNAPEIDHIIPLSCGPGSPGHVWSNVQCACRSCNIKKAGNILGQLRLSLEESAA